MLLLLDLALQEVNSPKQLLLRLNWFCIAKPKRVHLDLLKLEISLTTEVRAGKRYLFCELGSITLKQIGWA